MTSAFPSIAKSRLTRCNTRTQDWSSACGWIYVDGWLWNSKSFRPFSWASNVCLHLQIYTITCKFWLRFGYKNTLRPCQGGNAHICPFAVTLDKSKINQSTTKNPTLPNHRGARLATTSNLYAARDMLFNVAMDSSRTLMADLVNNAGRINSKSGVRMYFEMPNPTSTQQWHILIHQ